MMTNAAVGGGRKPRRVGRMIMLVTLVVWSACLGVAIALLAQFAATG
jgi:hypothetical protein